MSQFVGDLTLKVMLGSDGKPVPTSDGRVQWVGVPPPMAYLDKDGWRITFAPAEPTDLGSIPQFAWSLGFSPDGEGAEAFAIHDQGYKTKGTHVVNGVCWRTRPTPYTRREHDDMLRDGLKLSGVGVLRRNLIWLAVRLGGAPGWGS